MNDNAGGREAGAGFDVHSGVEDQFGNGGRGAGSGPARGVRLDAGSPEQVRHEGVLLNEAQLIEQAAVDGGSQERIVRDILLGFLDEGGQLLQCYGFRGRVREMDLRLFAAFSRHSRRALDSALDQVFQGGPGNGLGAEQVTDNQSGPRRGYDVPVKGRRVVRNAGGRCHGIGGGLEGGRGHVKPLLGVDGVRLQVAAEMLAQALCGFLAVLVVLFVLLADHLQQAGLLFCLGDLRLGGFDFTAELFAFRDCFLVVRFDAVLQGGQFVLQFFELFLHGFCPLFLKCF